MCSHAGADGVQTEVHPWQVISPDLPGRKVAILGCAADTLPAAGHIQDADVLVHHASHPRVHSPPVQKGVCMRVLSSSA